MQKRKKRYGRSIVKARRRGNIGEGIVDTMTIHKKRIIEHATPE
jgi:hypothetical protein